MDILPKNFLLSLDQGEVRRPIAARRGRPRNFLARSPLQSRRTVTRNESCPSVRCQGLPVVSASLRARYRRSASVAASSSARR
jgi:hypothetical protein